GQVSDRETGEKLYNAGVIVIGTYFGAVTDVDGKYTIQKIPVGDYSVKVQMLGYGEVQYNNIHIESGVPTVLNIELSTSPEQLQTVTIIGKAEQVDLETAGSERTLRREDIVQTNSRDVVEIVSRQAGVVKSPDGLQI